MTGYRPHLSWLSESPSDTEGVEVACRLLRGAGWFVTLLKLDDGESTARGSDVHVSPASQGEGWVVAVNGSCGGREDCGSVSQVMQAVIAWQTRRATRHASSGLDPSLYEDACRGCLIGVAVGDVIGLHVEMSPQERAKAYVARLQPSGGLLKIGAPWRAGGGLQRVIAAVVPELPAGQVSDDTQCACVLTESLVAERGHFHPSSFLKGLAAKHAGRSLTKVQQSGILGQGPTSRKSLNTNKAGADWLRAGKGSETSTSNGSCMRVGPLGLLLAAVGDPCDAEVQPAVTLLSHASSHLTHQSELCKVGAASVAAAVAAACRAGSIADAEVDTATVVASVLAAVDAQSSLLGSVVREMLRSPDDWAALEALHVAIPSNRGMKEAMAAGRLPGVTDAADGVTMHAFQTTAWAIFSFLRSPTSFWDTVLRAVAAGGDTDTVAAVAGAISGAFVGLRRLLEERPDATEMLSRLTDLSEDLEQPYVERLKGVASELATVALACRSAPASVSCQPPTATLIWGIASEPPDPSCLPYPVRVVVCATTEDVLSTTTSALEAGTPLSHSAVVPAPSADSAEFMSMLRRLRTLGVPTVVHQSVSSSVSPRLMAGEWARHVTESSEDAARLATVMVSQLEAPPRKSPTVIVVGISGPSRSGKSTLSKSLAGHFGPARSRIVHLDRYFDITAGGVGLPFMPESSELEEMLSTVGIDGRGGGNFDSPGSIAHEKALAECRESMTALTDKGTATAPAVLFVDGFMAFFDPALVELMDVRLWIELGFEEARTRRMSTKPLPAEYFDKCLWPNHLEYRRKCLEEPVGAGTLAVDLLDGANPQEQVLRESLQAIGRRFPQMFASQFAGKL